MRKILEEVGEGLNNLTRKLHNSMKFPWNEQEIFFELCKQFDGYCDCEILINAAPSLLGEETPW